MNEFTPEWIEDVRKHNQILENRSHHDVCWIVHHECFINMLLDEIQRLQAIIELVECKKQTVFETLTNTIQRRDKRIAELESEQRWIHMSERLPEKEGKYAVHGNIKALFTNSRLLDEWYCYFDGRQWVSGDNIVFWRTNIPIPQRQKDGE